jgi:hypothetical protein
MVSLGVCSLQMMRFWWIRVERGLIRRNICYEWLNITKKINDNNNFNMEGIFAFY